MNVFILIHVHTCIFGCRHIHNVFLRADGGELHVNCFEQEEACVADPDVVRHIH